MIFLAGTHQIVSAGVNREISDGVKNADEGENRLRIKEQPGIPMDSIGEPLQRMLGDVFRYQWHELLEAPG